MPKKRSKTNMRKEADRRFSQLIRSRGFCWAGFNSPDSGADFPCAGTVQTAHLVSRRYLSVRWDADNAVALCQAHHMYWTHHPIEWEQTLETWFPGRLAALKARALKPWDRDIEGVLERLKQAESA